MMRIFLVIDETCFYQPNFVAEVIRKTDHEFVGAALVTKVPDKHNIEKYIIRHWYYLKLPEIFKLGIKKINYLLKDRFLRNDKDRSFYRVSSVFRYFKIDYFQVAYNINQKRYLQKIREKKPDVIISSNSLIFGKELLSIPQYCINRHSALLPSYGGLWPVFQAVRRGEEQVGVSVHLMNEKIDRGVILSQEKIRISPNDTIDSLYKKCFAISASVTIRALQNIEKGIETVQNDYTPSYYSFPSRQNWQEFRKRKRGFI